MLVKTMKARKRVGKKNRNSGQGQQIINNEYSQAPVAYACNPSYSGGRD
jgi:hypothetical protein